MTPRLLSLPLPPASLLFSPPFLLGRVDAFTAVKSGYPPDSLWPRRARRRIEKKGGWWEGEREQQPRDDFAGDFANGRWHVN